MNDLPHRTHREVIEEMLELNDARVADIGCGDGALVRLMTRLGARATGIEPSEGQLGRARAAEPAGGEDYLQGEAEDLPLPDASLDVAVFFNSLHHVPVENHGRALAEAARALKPGGLLYVVEPIAAGPHFSVTRRIEDETLVRSMAYLALQAAFEGPDFETNHEFSYLTEIRYDDFEAYRDHLIAVDEGRRPAVEAQEDELRTAFEEIAERRDDAFVFAQPARLNLLQRA